MQDTKPLIQLKSLLFFFHATNTIIISFLPIYLAFKGLSGTEIGWVLAIGPLASIISQPFWGYLSDKYKTVKWVLIMSIIFMLIFSILFFQMNTLIFILIFGALFYFFSSPVGALSDSLAQRQADLKNISFGSIRMWGSIGFGLSSLLIGQLLDYIGVQMMIWPYLILGSILLILAFTIEDVKVTEDPVTSSDFITLLKHKPFVLFLITLALITVTHRANDSFIGLYIQEIGGSESLVGIAWFIALVSEALIFAFAYKWFIKKHALNYLILASLIYAVRWLLMSYTTEAYFILVLQLLHGLSFGIFYVASFDFVTRLIPEKLHASGHLIFYSMFFGLSGIIGSLSGGFMIENLGGSTLYIAMSFLALLGAIAFTLYKKQIKKGLS